MIEQERAIAGLPRVSGDRPPFSRDMPEHVKSAPRERGSTWGFIVKTPTAPVCPA